MPRRVTLVPLVLLALLAAAPPRTTERVEANDNRRAAGVLRDGVLTLRIETRIGEWHPDGDDAPGVPFAAFAEAGRAPQIPGPLVRVPAGTEARVTITNTLDSTLVVHGLAARPLATGASDSVVLARGETREVRFRLDAPGTYYYWASTTRRHVTTRGGEDSQLGGAIIVDSAGGPPPRDRVLVIGQWGFAPAVPPTTPRDAEHDLFVVNGRSWPHTERLAYDVGDTVRFRVVNATNDPHPMHLHGFYFQVDSRGDGVRDSTYDASSRDRAVTELVTPGRTIAITWVPERAGNWLFHCHLTPHVSPRGPLGTELETTGVQLAGAPHGGSHALRGMNGLVIGMTVRARGATSVSPRAPRRLRLLVRPSVGSSDSIPLYAFALQRGAVEPPSDSGPTAGPTLVIRRGEPTAITVVNHLPEPTAVHWHGLELESYFDGVAGFSGSAQRLSPVIAPGDSFVAHMTPPRAGTFIYHTHIDELRQQPAGLSGVLVVEDPAHPYDPAIDIPVLVTTPQEPRADARAVNINGSLAPAPIEMRAGVTHRLRLVNITVGRPGLVMELVRGDSTRQRWTPLAVDGADLPTTRRVERPSITPLTIGQTLDFAFTPTEPGELRLVGRTANGRVLGVLPVRVR